MRSILLNALGMLKQLAKLQSVTQWEIPDYNECIWMIQDPSDCLQTGK